MARLPFNPDRVPSVKKEDEARQSGASGGDLFAGGRGAGGKGDRPITVTQLAGVIKDAVVRAAPGKLRVVGEISNFSQRAHWFFSLKDEAASIRCVCFASSARRVNFPVEDGMQVIATGRLDFFDAAGNVQLYVDALEPVGQGALEMKFRALCEELRRLGYFEAERKRPLPVMPRRVAVVTSRSAAALQDVINTARRRWAGCELFLYDVRVQGDAAAAEIARALDMLSKHGPRMGMDAIILTRGGGSMEDLWAFNERVVADAVFRCTLPVIAAIGHETDTTVAELVADVRASTPTQAAMTLIPDRATLDQQVRQLSHRLALVLRRQAEMSGHRLNAAARHPIFRRPEAMVQPHADRLRDLMRRLRVALLLRVRGEADALAGLARRLMPILVRRTAESQRRVQAVSVRLSPSLERRVSRGRERLTSLTRELEAVGPTNVLKRGYSYTLGPNGEILRRAIDVTPGDRVTTVLGEGRIESVIEGTQTEDGPRRKAAPVNKTEKQKPKSEKAKPRSNEGDPGLFN